MATDADTFDLVYKIKELYVKDLEANPGHANGFNPEQYLKNLSYHTKKYNRAMKAVRELENYFYFQKVKLTCSNK